MIQQANESDWKLFRARLPDWQEAYMERLNNEYIAILSAPGPASGKFWRLEKRLREDKTSIGVVSRMSRSYMEINIMNLLSNGVITLDDLNGFSEDLREKMAHI